MKILNDYLHYLDEQVAVRKVGMKLINNPEIKTLLSKIRNGQIELAKLRKLKQTPDIKQSISTKLMLLNTDRKMLSYKLDSLKSKINLDKVNKKLSNYKNQNKLRSAIKSGLDDIGFDDIKFSKSRLPDLPKWDKW